MLGQGKKVSTLAHLKMVMGENFPQLSTLSIMTHGREKLWIAFNKSGKAFLFVRVKNFW